MAAMGKCCYCGNDFVSNNGDGHSPCWAEFDRRKANALCKFCGEKLADSDIEERRLGHEACYGPYIFSGYPGQ